MNLTFGTGDHNPLVRVSVCLLNRPVGGNHLCQEIDIPEKYIVWYSGFNQTVWWGLGVRNGGGGQAKLGNGRILVG